MRNAECENDKKRIVPSVKIYAKKLEANGLFSMGEVARCSIRDEERLYRLFGVNAELLIDQAWGWEPCTIADIKVYKPESSSVGSGQVLQCPYSFEKAKLVVREMTELLDRIRDIRSSEKVLYRQVLDLYATSADYDPKSEESVRFFKIVQKKLHFAAHGHTAAEVIYERANAAQPLMGLTSFSGGMPTLKDIGVAKNYLKDAMQIKD